MNIARILYPVTVLGPGNRIGIWMSGCPRRCPGCSNPELWQRCSELEIPVSEVEHLIEKIVATNKVDGFTITGGEPMAQHEELAELINYLKTISADILVYSGYSYKELRHKASRSIDAILKSIAVIIDGEYVEDLNTNAVLRGSENQNIIILNKEYKKFYDNYLGTAHNQIQNFTTSDGVISVGIHRRDFANEISLRISNL